MSTRSSGVRLHDRPAPSRTLVAAAAVLLALLGLVATLQYRWLGEVSAAERQRLQTSLRDRASQFTADVDRELSVAFRDFQVDGVSFDRDPVAALRQAMADATRDSVMGSAVKAVLVAESGPTPNVRQLDAVAGTLAPVEWPAPLRGVARRLAEAPPIGAPGVPLPPGLGGSGVDADAPALIVPVTKREPVVVSTPGVVIRTAPAQASWQAVVVWLDPDLLRDRVLAPMAARHFGAADASDFNIVVQARTDGRVLYQSGVGIDPRAADLTTTLFALRLDELRWRVDAPSARPATGTSAPDGAPKTITDRLAITIVHRGTGETGDATVETSAAGGWTMLAQARRGSLDAVVAQSRRRNLAVSLGVVGVLGASVILLLVTSAREQRLVRQQLEFVASVSHELRTPLAVIRSAGENLADGVVSGAQVAEYGDLIQAEGRRLTEMVDRVMDFAGMTGGAAIRSRRRVAAGDAVREAVSSLSYDAAQRQIQVVVEGTDPAVSGDPAALTTAMRNVVGNAIKYSEPGAEVRVAISSAADTVRIVVSDRGIGIDREDLPHVFEPFYRGRRAVDSQVRGSGVGLSVVRQVVVAHGGRIRVEPREGGGTQVTIDLPLAGERIEG